MDVSLLVFLATKPRLVFLVELLTLKDLETEGDHLLAPLNVDQRWKPKSQKVGFGQLSILFVGERFQGA